MAVIGTLEDLARVLTDLLDVATGRAAHLTPQQQAAHRATLGAILTPEPDTTPEPADASASELTPEPGPGDAADGA